MELSRIKFVWVLKFGLGISLLFFIYLLLLITLQYFPIRYDVAFLILKENEIHHTYYKIAFYTHVLTSWFVIFFGFFQFWKWIRRNHSIIHRGLGKAYILIVLFLSGPSGLVMSLVANGGFFSQISFILLTILWLFFTAIAYKMAMKKDWRRHEEYMIRSYALTLSAISLRLFKLIIVHTLELPPMETYKIVAWGGWVFNLILAESYIKFKTK